MSRGWLVQVVCDGIALGRSVVYATQLRGSGRLIVVGCVQWQLVDRLYMRHNCAVVADSSLLGVCNGSLGVGGSRRQFRR